MYMSYVLDFKEKQMEGTHNREIIIWEKPEPYLTRTCT